MKMTTKKKSSKSKKISSTIKVTGTETEIMIIPLKRAQYQRYVKKGVSQDTFDDLMEELESNTESYLQFDPYFNLTVNGRCTPINWKRLYKDALKREANQSIEQSKSPAPTLRSKKKTSPGQFALFCERDVDGNTYEVTIQEKFDSSKLKLDIFTDYAIDDSKCTGIYLYYGNQEFSCDERDGGSSGESIYLISSHADRTSLDIW